LAQVSDAGEGEFAKTRNLMSVLFNHGIRYDIWRAIPFGSYDRVRSARPSQSPWLQSRLSSPIRAGPIMRAFIRPAALKDCEGHRLAYYPPNVFFSTHTKQANIKGTQNFFATLRAGARSIRIPRQSHFTNVKLSTIVFADHNPPPWGESQSW